MKVLATVLCICLSFSSQAWAAKKGASKDENALESISDVPQLSCPSQLVKVHKVVETEYKYAFGLLEFQKLSRMLGQVGNFERAHTIVNHYLDTEDFDLYQAGYRLRLRIIDNKHVVLSLKTVMDAPELESGVHSPKVRLEQEIPLTMLEADSILNGGLKPATDMAFPNSELLKGKLSKKLLKKVTVLGHSAVRRQVFLYEGLKWELDQAWIEGEQYFELEIEVGEHEFEKDVLVQTILKDHKIEFEENPDGKTRRFRKLYRERH